MSKRKYGPIVVPLPKVPDEPSALTLTRTVRTVEVTEPRTGPVKAGDVGKAMRQAFYWFVAGLACVLLPPAVGIVPGVPCVLVAMMKAVTAAILAVRWIARA